MNKLMTILLLLVIHNICNAQEATVSKIGIFELIGTWSNMANSYNQDYGSKNGKKIGNVSDSRISVPVVDVFYSRYIKIGSEGNFVDLKYPNAKWKLEDDFLVITLQFGQKFHGLLNKNDSTGIYKLTFNGETFIKNRGF